MSLLAKTTLFASLAVMIGCVTTSATRRIQIDMDYVWSVAKSMADEPYEREIYNVPESYRDLSYDDYRKIRFKNDQALWKEQGLPFHIHFFHLGYLFNEPLEFYEFTATHEQRIRYISEWFDFEDLAPEAEMPPSIGYAGFKAWYPFNGERYDEVVSFLGASYFRALGANTRYGLSARGLAIDTGLSRPEEFPVFKRFWLGKPLGNAKELQVFAILDSPSVVGAYSFLIKPGVDTRVEVEARLRFRKDTESVGLAPLTSMYWQGENTQLPAPDYRPEIHDSDGLRIELADGSTVWRPLAIASENRFSYFATDQAVPFGLIQRDRDFDHYQDLEAAYEERPTLWIQPQGTWPEGHVKLVELTTENEFMDNIVAFWELKNSPKAGEEIAFRYDMVWTKQDEPTRAETSKVIATRLGKDANNPVLQQFVIDFEAQGEVPPEVKATAYGAISLRNHTVIYNPHADAWRVTLFGEASGDPDARVAELTCQLLFEDGTGSEIWSYQWNP